MPKKSNLLPFTSLLRQLIFTNSNYMTKPLILSFFRLTSLDIFWKTSALKRLVDLSGFFVDISSFFTFTFFPENESSFGIASSSPLSECLHFSYPFFTPSLPSSLISIPSTPFTDNVYIKHFLPPPPSPRLVFLFCVSRGGVEKEMNKDQNE